MAAPGRDRRPVSTAELQRSLQASGASPLAKYQDLYVGSRGLWRLFLYDSLLLASGVPGAAGKTNVIGRPGKNIAAAQARDWIAGFTIFNDFSARDFQLYEMAGRLGPAKSKDFDTGNVLGPWLVTPDEVGDPYKR